MSAPVFDPAQSCTFAVAHGVGTPTVSVHATTGLQIMLALGLDRPQRRSQIAGNLDPTDVIARATMFRFGVEAGWVLDQPDMGIDVAKLCARVDQVVAIAEQAAAAGSRVVFA